MGQIDLRDTPLNISMAAKRLRNKLRQISAAAFQTEKAERFFIEMVHDAYHKGQITEKKMSELFSVSCTSLARDALHGEYDEEEVFIFEDKEEVYGPN